MNIRKILLITVGIINLIMGGIGAALPLLPAFPFLLLASICFAKSSKRLNDWFIKTNLYKNNLEQFVTTKTMKRKVKIKIMIIITLTMSVGFIMMKEVKIGQIILFGVWLFHLFYFAYGIKESN